MSAAHYAEASTSSQGVAGTRGKRKSGPADDAAWNYEDEQAE